MGLQSIFADSSFEPSTFLAAAKDVTPLEVSSVVQAHEQGRFINWCMW